MALINPKCIGEPELCLRSDAPTSERQGTATANQQKQRKLNFIHQPFPMRLETMSSTILQENVSQDLVHLTTSDIEASASFDSKSEEREEITEIVDVPAFTPAHTPAPALEGVEEQSHTPGSRKSMRQNFGRPAISYSDFYM